MNFGCTVVRVLPFGILYKVNGNDALIVNYLIGVSIKGNSCYLNDVTLERLLNKLDSVHIDYYYNNSLHSFINNNYNLYLGYSYKKIEIEQKYFYELSHIEDNYE